MMFWLLATLMIMLALLPVLWPLFRPSDEMPLQADQVERELVNTRLEELQRDLHNNVIDTSQADSVRRELERELPHADTAREKRKTAETQRRWKSIFAILLFVPLFASGLYLMLGNPAMQETEPLRAMKKFTVQLESYLEEHPGDEKAWLVLAHYYMALGMEREAAAAVARLSRIPAETAEQQQADQPGKDALKPGEESIRTNVSLLPEFSSEVEPTDTLFIYVKSLQGSSMPIVASRHQAGDLPLQIVLNDSMSIREDRKLSDFKYVELVARVSRSGDTSPQAGDLMGVMSGVSVGPDAPVDLVIDRKIH